ncbi:MAG: LysM peptidoglycan-binding domain-containing protein [Bacteroidota bacterium]
MSKDVIKRVLSIISYILLFHAGTAFALVTDSIGVVRKSDGSYVRHQIDKGDTWYSVARRYGITYAELKLANKDAPEMLKTGQVLLVPPKAKPTDPRNQKNHMNTDGVNPGIAATSRHMVNEGETVYSIAKRYSVTQADLISWNRLSADAAVVPGQVLIVKKAISTETGIPEYEKPVRTEKKKEVVETVKTENLIGENKLATPLSGYVFAGGRKQVSEKGLAGFIGEEEGYSSKYYALHRTAPVGTVIKVTNRLNGKSVFVKVVGVLPEVRDNDGIVIKISKPGADQLGAKEQRFVVELLYGISEW